jgi:hypothetical protein
MDWKWSLGPAHIEDPFLSRDRIFEGDAIMASQIIGMGGGALTREIGGTGTHHTTYDANLLCLQATVEQLAYAKRDIDSFIDQIQTAIHQYHADIDAWVFLEKIRNDRKKIKPSQGDGGGEKKGFPFGLLYSPDASRSASPTS